MRRRAFLVIGNNGQIWEVINPGRMAELAQASWSTTT
jgi:hypothetical protein